MIRELCTRLDVLRPSTEASRSSSVRTFALGEKVLVRDFRAGQKWQAGVVEKQLDHLLYHVRVGDAQLKRHVD